MRHEGYNRFFGDVLTCKACGEDIYHVGTWVRFRDIDRAYKLHARGCMGLKKLIIIERRQRQAQELINRYIDPMIETLSKKFC